MDNQPTILKASPSVTKKAFSLGNLCQTRFAIRTEGLNTSFLLTRARVCVQACITNLPSGLQENRISMNLPTTQETNYPPLLATHIEALQRFKNELERHRRAFEATPGHFTEGALVQALSQTWRAYREAWLDLDLRSMNQPLETRRKIAAVAIEPLFKIKQDAEIIKTAVEHLLVQIPKLIETLITFRQLY